MKAAVFALFVLTSAGIACAQGAPENRVTKEQVGRTSQKTETPDDEHGNSKVTVIVKQQNSPQHDQEKQETAEDIDIQKSNLAVGRWLVLVGFIQAIILMLTIRAINRQNETSKNIERAWIMAELRCYPSTSLLTETSIIGTVESMSTSLMGIELYCVNDGNSPAWITEKSARLVVVKEGELPRIPELDAQDVLRSEIEPIGPGRESLVVWDAIGKGRHSVETATMIYGVIKYTDIFKKKRETWFCYQLTGYKTNRQLRRIAGYPEYNKNT